MLSLVDWSVAPLTYLEMRSPSKDNFPVKLVILGTAYIKNCSGSIDSSDGTTAKLNGLTSLAA